MTTHHDHEHDSDGMFPRWPVTFDPPARRIVDPPQPVIVSINAALSVTSSTSLRDGIPLRVRAEGFSNGHESARGTAWLGENERRKLARIRQFHHPDGKRHGPAGRTAMVPKRCHHPTAMTDTTTPPDLDAPHSARESTPQAQHTGEHMNIGDRFHVAPGASSVVVVREIRVNGLVMVENETPGHRRLPLLDQARPLHPRHHTTTHTRRARRNSRNRTRANDCSGRRQLPRRTQRPLTLTPPAQLDPGRTHTRTADDARRRPATTAHAAANASQQQRPRARKYALNDTPAASAARATSSCSDTVNRTGTILSRGSPDFGLPRCAMHRYYQLRKTVALTH